MSGWPLVGLVAGLAVVVVAALGVAFAGRESEERHRRRGGLLELDTPAARAAIAQDPDDWFDGEAA